MEPNTTIVGVFPAHDAADAAVRALVAAGFDPKRISVIGRGAHAMDPGFSFHHIGDQIRFWGTRGAFWGGLWGLLFGGLFIAFPEAGIVIVLGYLAATALSGWEIEALAGGFGALVPALSRIGIADNNASHYRTAIETGGFLVMIHGFAQDTSRAEAILAQSQASRITSHPHPGAIAG